MMTAALILGFSCVALLQFFISYCRSIIAASTAQPLSEQVREVTGIRDGQIRGEEFVRLLQLTSLCPDSGTDHDRYYGGPRIFPDGQFCACGAARCDSGNCVVDGSRAYRLRSFCRRGAGPSHFAQPQPHGATIFPHIVVSDLDLSSLIIGRASAPHLLPMATSGFSRTALVNRFLKHGSAANMQLAVS